jgi:hypothetical protein
MEGCENGKERIERDELKELNRRSCNNERIVWNIVWKKKKD